MTSVMRVTPIKLRPSGVKAKSIEVRFEGRTSLEIVEEGKTMMAKPMGILLVGVGNTSFPSWLKQSTHG